jgi:hypothetical protein
MAARRADILVTENNDAGLPGAAERFAVTKSSRTLKFVQPSAQRVGVDEVREDLFALDGDDREPLAVGALELGVARDVDLAEVERDLRADALEHGLRALAQVAALRPEERDDRERRQG